MMENNSNVRHSEQYSPKEIGEILEVVSSQVPDLLTKLWRILYSTESAQEMGKAVGTLYKELVEAGIPKETALKMTSDYMFSLKDLTSNVFAYSDQQKNDWKHRS